MEAEIVDAAKTAEHIEAAAVMFDSLDQPLLARYCRQASAFLADQQRDLHTLRNQVTTLQTDLALNRSVARTA